jgi:outer membrane protein OmpA-like peptidoglycan-associated protein
MAISFVVRRALVVLGLLAVPALAGCQTVAGFGRDVQQTGRWITGGATGTEAALFGPQDQAGNMNGSMGMNASAGSQGTMTPVAHVADARDNVVYFATGSADVPPDGMAEIRDIASASNSGQGPDQTSMQGADNGSMQSSANSAGQSSDGNAMQNAQNVSTQGSAGNSGQVATGNSGQGMPRIQVIGYTDTVGSAASNRKLSQRRAEAVADALAAQGVPRDSIDVQWHGEDQLPVPTADGVPEPQNRRVRITMTE